MALEIIAGIDRQGGIVDRRPVRDHHQDATLLAASSEGLAGNVSGYNPTVPQMFANGAGQNINQIGQQLTRRDLQVQPTITVRPGFSVNVIVTKDVVLPPYATGRAAPGRTVLSPARLP